MSEFKRQRLDQSDQPVFGTGVGNPVFPRDGGVKRGDADDAAAFLFFHVRGDRTGDFKQRGQVDVLGAVKLFDRGIFDRERRIVAGAMNDGVETAVPRGKVVFYRGKIGKVQFFAAGSGDFVSFPGEFFADGGTYSAMSAGDKNFHFFFSAKKLQNFMIYL